MPDSCSATPEARLTPRLDLLPRVAAAIRPNDRVLVTGGSGWLGRTTLALLWATRGADWVRAHVHATASRPRTIEVAGCGPVQVHAGRGGFRPTVVVNTAFPTQDRVATLGYGTYVESARSLTAELLDCAQLPGVRKVVTFSSGAAVPSARYPADETTNPYGVLKATEEQVLLAEAARSGFSASVCRVWAVSGPHVQEPSKYAFSDFVLQARRGAIEVRASVPVIRQYASADDVVTVALTAEGLFNTGGAIVEVGELAKRIAERTGASVRRDSFDPGAPADEYRGDDRAWDGLLAGMGLAAANLREQVDAVVTGMPR